MYLETSKIQVHHAKPTDQKTPSNPNSKRHKFNFFFNEDSSELKAISRLSAFLVNTQKKFPSAASIYVFLLCDVSLTHLGTSKLLSNHWWHGKLSCLKKMKSIFCSIANLLKQVFCYFCCTNCVLMMPAASQQSKFVYIKWPLIKCFTN